tara:strand:- start:568 stop:774 length:207 start_codon:yes stop_codon:yes gene_type:complete
MDGIKNISSHNQNNHNNYYNVSDEKNNADDQDKQTFDLAQILKTGYQKRKFSNTSTISWLQTWRISNL